MLLKIFTVLGAISLLGGFANCQYADSNQNDQVMKLLMSMMSNGATKKADDNQLMQVLLTALQNSMGNKQDDNNQMVQMLMKLMSNGNSADNNMNENQMLQLLMSSGFDLSKLNQNQMTQLLTMMMGKGGADSNKLNQNQLMQLMTLMMAGNGGDGLKLNENQMMQMLTMLMGGAKETPKTTDNQLLQLLMAMMGGDKEKETPKTDDNQLLQLLMAMMGGEKEKDTPKTNDNQMLQMLISMMGGAKDAPKNNENSMMQLLLPVLIELVKDTPQKNDNQMMQLLMLAMANNKQETKKKEGCAAIQNMDKPVNPETAAWIEMMKVDSIKKMFKQEKDYTKFTKMVDYVEEHSKNDWISQFVKQMTDNDMMMHIGEQIVNMMENDEKVKESIKEFIEGNKELYEFTQKAIKWMKMTDFKDSTPLIRKIVRIFLDMDLKNLKVDEAWYDNYMSWVNCTFGQKGELASLMKTVGMMSKAEDTLMPYLEGFMQPKIEVKMQVFAAGKIRCGDPDGAPVEVVRQSLHNIYALVIQKKLLCGYTSFKTFQRQSSVTKEMGTFIQELNVPNATPNLWKVTIKRGGKVIANDVDMSYVPKNGDLIYAALTDQ